MTFQAPTAARMKAAAKALPTYAAFAIKALSVAAAFSISVLLARVAGPEAFGQYVLATTTLIFLTFLPIRGLDQVLLRRVSRDLPRGRISQAKWTIATISGFILVRSIFASLIYVFCIAFTPLPDILNGDTRILLVSSAALAFWPMMNISITIVRSFSKPTLAQLFEGFHSILIATVLFIFFMNDYQITSLFAITLFVSIAGLSVLIQWSLIFLHLKSVSPVPSDEPINCSTDGIPFFITLIASALTDYVIVLILSISAGAEEVAQFRAVFQIVITAMIIIGTGETISMPKLAHDFANGRPDMAWKRFRRMRAITITLALPITFLSLVFPELLMVSVFGEEFRASGTALQIAAAAQLVNLLSGPTGGMLIMSGREKMLLTFNLVTMLIVSVLGVILVPKFGLIGAAFAYSSGIIFKKLASYIALRVLIPSVVHVADKPSASK